MEATKTAFISAAVGVGLVAALHLALSARAAETLGSPRAANAVFWSVGALTAITIMLASGDSAPLRRIGAVPRFSGRQAPWAPRSYSRSRS